MMHLTVSDLFFRHRYVSDWCQKCGQGPVDSAVANDPRYAICHGRVLEAMQNGLVEHLQEVATMSSGSGKVSIAIYDPSIYELVERKAGNAQPHEAE